LLLALTKSYLAIQVISDTLKSVVGINTNSTAFVGTVIAISDDEYTNGLVLGVQVASCVTNQFADIIGV
jgi:hypothetical protein